MRRAATTILLLALLAAGCGARSSKPFTAKGTIGCLRSHGFRVTTDPSQVGFIAAFADNGGLRAASKSGNTATVAFTKDESTVAETANAFRSHASAALRPHFADVLRENRNAVVVWTTAPTPDDDKTLSGCLSP